MCAWVLDELGREFEIIEMAPGEAQSDEFLAINPNGKVPALVDGDLKLFESMAISHYLARNYGNGSLWPDSTRDQAVALQWAFWAATELEPPLVTVFGQTLFTPPADRDESAMEKARLQAGKALAVLESVLAEHDMMLGPQFSIADINIASVLAPARYLAKLDVESFPAVHKWHDACLQRSSARRMTDSLKAFANRLEQGLPPR
tara:strand:+ start:4848 stop:5459 length:612 start_codon:yes stop_codon:yes gene_type:complete